MLAGLALADSYTSNSIIWITADTKCGPCMSLFKLEQ